MNRAKEILLGTLLIGGVATCYAQKSSNELLMVVGSYTNGSAEGIASYIFNQESGEFSMVSSAKSSNPSYLAFSSCGNFLYAVNENSAEDAAISSFSFNRESGEVTPINSVKVLGAAPCYIELMGDRAISANYTGGSISVVEINQCSGEVESLLLHQEFNHSKNEKKSHLHTAVTTPDGEYLLATDLGHDKIYTFKREDILAKDLGDCLPYQTTRVKEGSGPRHLAINSSGERLYLLNELSGTVITYSLKDGHLAELATAKADSVGGNGSADIHISGDGKFLYATNRLKEDGISTFKICQEDGSIEKIAYNNTGSHPRNFIITPNDKYLLVACKNSNCIEIFKRDITSGLLTKEEKMIEVDSPVCIKFAK